MIIEDRWYADKLKSFVSNLFQPKKSEIELLCSENLRWRINDESGNLSQLESGIKHIIIQRSQEKRTRVKLSSPLIWELSNGFIQISADIMVESENWNQEIREYMEMLLTFSDGLIVSIYVVCVKKRNDIIYRVKEVNEDFHRIRGTDVLYIEANHNHVIWHCVDREIVSNDSLHHLEGVVSNQFIRIQRGYLVNKGHIKCVRRCEAVMDNGDILPIPNKKYVRVKEEIQK